MAAKRNFGISLFLWILILLIYQVVECHSYDGYIVRPSYDICNPDTPGEYPPTVYLGDANKSTEVYVNWPAMNHTAHYNCRMLFRSCSSCQITVEPAASFSYPKCNSDISHINNGACAKGCIYFQIFDADYQSHTSQSFSMSAHLRDYSTQSRQLHVIACGEGIYNTKVAMRLRISVKKKDVLYNMHQWSSPQVFSSPYFPNAYTLNEEEYKYEFIGRNGAYFSVMFTDWLISPHSYLKFYNANIVNQISGAARRPYIQSTGPKMTVVFHTGPNRNVGMRIGFRAVATYYTNQDSIPKVLTDCDSYITDSGGTLRLSDHSSDGRLRDCIWVIKKPIGYEGVNISIVRLRLKHGSDQKIEVMEGLTSRGPRKLYAEGGILNSVQGEKSRFESTRGFYIHLRGHFSDTDALVVSYVSYYSGCSPYPPFFTCGTKNCIADYLQCDGYDHCGDNSDEASYLCGYSENNDRHASSHSVSVGVIIPIVVSVVLVIAMCLVIIFVRRCRKLSHETYGSAHSRRRQRNSRGHHRRRRDGNVRMSVTVSSGEHPPSYQEVMQTTPSGQLNMAYSGSGAISALIQPPSYEEAIGNNSSEMAANDIEQALNAESFAEPHDGRNERAIDVGPIEAFNSSLAPNSYVSSSSSSEDLSEARMYTSSSDSSTDNNSFASHRHGDESRRPKNEDHNMFKEDGDLLKDEGKTVALVDSDESIVLCPSSALKIIKHQETNKRMSQAEDNQVIQDTDKQENKRNEIGYNSHFNKEKGTYTNEDNSAEVTPAHRQHSEERDRQKDTNSCRENRRVNRNERIKPRHANDAMGHMGPNRMYHDHENNGRYRSTETVRDRDHCLGPYNSSSNHRSQSLADISYSGSPGLSVFPSPKHSLSGTDKRFSYAGTGDTTFRNRRDPYSSGDLICDNLVDNLHDILPQRENRPRENPVAAAAYTESNQKMRKNGHLSQSADQLARMHATHSSKNRNNLQGSQLMLERDISSSLDAVPEMKGEEEYPRNHARHHPKAHQQHDQMYRYGEPSDYKPHEKYASASYSPSQVTEHGHWRSVEPSGLTNNNSAESPPREPRRGYENKDYPDYHSLDRTRPYPSNNDFNNCTGRKHSGSASSEDGRPRPPRPSIRQNHPKSQSAAITSAQPLRHTVNSCDNTRPRPAPRRSVVNSCNPNSKQQIPPRGLEFQSTSAPLTVINYVASTESRHMEDSDGDETSQYPLAQLVFKTTNDDVFI